MKVLILAGGFGTRISEETGIRPKPMIEIGGNPIIWHIMKIYSYYGYNEFVILLGYKGNYIKEYFLNYFSNHSDFTIDFASKNIDYLKKNAEKWKVSLIDTGLNTMTGGRIKRVKEIIGDDPFMLTYGDGVANININNLVDEHQKSKKLATMTTVIPDGRFGRLDIRKDNSISKFIEKPKEENWINGGFFVCENKVLDYIDGDKTIFERKPLENLANNNELNAYKHDGFWKCMDSLSDKNILEKFWNNDPKWKLW